MRSSISPIRDPSFLQGGEEEGEEEAMNEEEEAEDEEEEGFVTENVPDNNHPNRSLHVPDDIPDTENNSDIQRKLYFLTTSSKRMDM
ncbi:hypothetical protein Zmor_021589 [Zophobas morio]|uniref:Uncharacterized protein n=1 Tax=Zophobas morio TaxID=2755281 RepID=A0AA38I841_9CUCU|nr:hypothetical protein Zmor_021589 [Zophobas morio]